MKSGYLDHPFCRGVITWVIQVYIPGNDIPFLQCSRPATCKRYIKVRPEHTFMVSRRPQTYFPYPWTQLITVRCSAPHRSHKVCRTPSVQLQRVWVVVCVGRGAREPRSAAAAWVTRILQRGHVRGGSFPTPRASPWPRLGFRVRPLPNVF